MFSKNCSIELIFHSIYIFSQLLVHWTKIKPIQAIIILLIIYLSSIVLWIFSYHIWVVDCWPFFPHWYDQRSLNLKLVLAWDWKFSVECIQTILTYFLSAYVCGRSYIGCRLGVQTCLLQFIDLLYLKSLSSSSLMPSFVDFWLFVSYLLEHILLVLKLVLRCEWKLSLCRT